MPIAVDRKVPLSCFIITRNEADRVGRVIEAVIGWVDDVVVVDSGSTDDTPQVATRLGARVIHHDWVGYGPQKRFAEDQCRNDWLLNLDADEVPTDALCREIMGLFEAGPPPHPFYRFRVRLVYPGDERPRRWAPANTCLRLYDRREGRFSDSLVHDSVLPGEVVPRQLKEEVWHYSYRSFSHLVDKLNEYGDLQALSADGGKSASMRLRLPIEFPVSFVKYYFLRRHFTGGAKGFSFAMINSFFRFLRLVKIIDHTGRR